MSTKEVFFESIIAKRSVSVRSSGSRPPIVLQICWAQANENRKDFIMLFPVSHILIFKLRSIPISNGEESLTKMARRLRSDCQTSLNVVVSLSI